MNSLVLGVIIFLIAVLMTMTGRGGGNFYVLAIVLSGVSMHESAATGQFILFVSSISATLIFGRDRMVEWRLVIAIGLLTALSAFFGGYVSDYVSGKMLKFIFSFFLLIAAFLMLRTVDEKQEDEITKKPGHWYLKSGDHEYSINLGIAVPVILFTGFGAGMVGVSGGSFLVPLMVLACRVPMKIAVGTSTTMVAGTALMGFAGHALSGHFVPGSAVPLAVAAAVGGIIGGSVALKTKSAVLKKLFAYTTMAASLIMVLNAVLTNP
ncbi:MAG TPA: sulfite exporter TauE/SafE family protein [Spirochaetota bacterium]|nr:sulfite exporter TauE/SafE family protein [Spirochaetota bacterium]HPJ38119.1 sulfite exporter TauE/SafE family protein [Spirochaetota bacterium]HPQ54209.1 sulfite exporter TauE/SafE family protein [Spirochaetota bacterium]